jgi:ferredoxin
MNEHFTIELLGDGMLSIEEGQTILEASLKAGIPHYHASPLSVGTIIPTK